LVHGIEAFGSNAHSPLTDLHALEAIRLVAAHLRASVEAPSDLALRGDIMLASLQAGLAFSNASLGCVHSMAHSLGGSLDLPHGECNALLLPFVLDFNFQSAPERYLQVGEALGLSVKGLGEHAARAALVRGVLELRRQCGIDGGLRVRGVHTADLGPLATTAMDDPCNATNPREPHRGDLRALYAEAM
jgi:alcohol dehydrogenase class IV